MSEDESTGNIENDLEEILGENELEEQVEVGNDQANDGETNKEVVKPKRVVKNPQPKLNEQTLKGHRGIEAIESYFQRVKFKGRGYEEQDLNTLLKTYEYWCHRLFPKFPFESCIARLEKLGTKRATQTQIKKIRMGLVIEEPQNPLLSDEEVNDTTGFVDTYNDQFDRLVATEQEPEISEEQMERIRENMERAKRLREEKLKKIREHSQLEVGNSVVTQESQSFETNTPGGGVTSPKQVSNEIEAEDPSSVCSIAENGDEISENLMETEDVSQNNPEEYNAIHESINDNSVLGDCKSNKDNSNGMETNVFNNSLVQNDICESVKDSCDAGDRQSNIIDNVMETDISNNSLGEDNEDDIDNILDFINTDDNSDGRQKASINTDTGTETCPGTDSNLLLMDDK